jgi:hypothetical protein
MTYNSAIPLATDTPADNQLEIMTNFLLLNTFFGQDHIPFLNGSVNGTGFHEQVTLNAPLPAFPNAPPPNASLFSFVANNIAFLRYQNDITSVSQKALTGIKILAQNKEGVSFTTPWGMILSMGEVFDQTGSTVFQFPVPFTVRCFFLNVTTLAAQINPNIPIFSYGNILSPATFEAISYTPLVGHPNTFDKFFKSFYFAIGI